MIKLKNLRALAAPLLAVVWFAAVAGTAGIAAASAPPGDAAAPDAKNFMLPAPSQVRHFDIYQHYRAVSEPSRGAAKNPQQAAAECRQGSPAQAAGSDPGAASACASQAASSGD